jgi:predicted extracellular nuclease
LDAIIRRSAVDEQYETRTRRERLMMRFVGRLVVMGVVGAGAVFGSKNIADAGLLISGIIDGPRSGGLPKVVELYATEDIADLSTWDLEFYFNATVTPGVTAVLSGSASAGDYVYVASESVESTAYFGFAPDFTNGGSFNGDDSVVLRENSVQIDVFGSPGTDGTGQPWEYLDSWFYRVDGTSASTTWTAADWTSPGVNALDSLGATGTNPASGSLRMPVGTYAAVVPEPSFFVFAGLGVAAVGWRLRRRR